MPACQFCHMSSCRRYHSWRRLYQRSHRYSIAVSENTTYYVAIGLDGTTGNVGFNIKYNVTPDNDDPCAGGFTAVDIPGTLNNQDNTCANR